MTIAHINTGNQLPGLAGLLKFRPETAVHLNALMQALLRSDDNLSPGEREFIFTMASWTNNCRFCSGVHAECAKLYLGDKQVEMVFNGTACALMDKNNRLHELLHVAQDVALLSGPLTDLSVKLARDAGASDKDIHDTVLIASAACMFNRYVDALNADVPKGISFYKEIAKVYVNRGYVNPTF